MSELFRSKITIDKNICHGKPHIVGTRIMVHQVLDLLAADATIEEIIEQDFPDLTRDDILVCIAYANKAGIYAGQSRDIYENNHVNFGDPAAIVSRVPLGTGVLILAADEVEVTQKDLLWKVLAKQMG